MPIVKEKLQTKGYCVPRAKAPLEPFKFERREPGPCDILIEILYCGICHSDIHQARDEWGGSTFPMVPGHEIVGRVSRVGDKVTRFKPGAIAGVGCFIDSDRTCGYCRRGLQQYCSHTVWTYNSKDKDGSLTCGGYSSNIVVDEDYAYKISPDLPLERVAPLLCAGITTYSPLRFWKVSKGSRVGIIGLGGLGHMAVKLASSMGAEVTVFSTSRSKENDAKRLGASNFALSTDEREMNTLKGRFDFILSTISAPYDIEKFIQLLRAEGTITCLGVPPEPFKVGAFSLIERRLQLAGSLIGGVPETQEMLDYCASKKILADVEVIPASKINEAYDRMIRGDVRYRFVIDAKTL
jgi:uncharacterized zinc-type alcohol dehydrogenase-like protein